MSGFSVTSAERCLAILELLVDEPQGMPLSVIAQRLALPVSATHRLLSVLVARRHIRQDAVSERYVITLRIASLGLRLLAATKLPDVCQPVLDALAEKTGEFVRLSVVDGKHLTWVAKAQGSRSNIRYDPAAGRDVPLHATAMGKAWLASLPEEEAVRIVLDRGFGGDFIGPNAVRTIEALRQQLRLTRERGFGLVDEEAEPGISAVAVAVRDSVDPRHPVVGCVSIGGPKYRLSQDHLMAFAPFLAATAAGLAEVWPLRAFFKAQSSDAAA